MRRSILKVATGLVALLIALSQSALAAAAYEPVLPKVRLTERIIVVDVAKDVHGDDSHNVLLAITCLQGLVNRQSTEKVYLVNFPWRLNWDWSKQKRFAGVHPAQATLDDGLLPFPATVAKLDDAKTYPALSYLLARYKAMPKGKVLCPEAGKATSGPRAAAVNACTFESALPLTERLDAYAQGEGVELPLVADTRKMDEMAAFDWSVSRYMKHPQRNRKLLGFQGDIGSNTPIMADYFVATGTFCYFLDAQSINDPEPEDAKFDVLAAVQHYPPGVPHIGPVEGARVIQRIQKRGHLPVCGFLGNASVTSSVPTSPKMFRKTPLKAHPLENDALYLAWEVHDDGDALDVNGLVMYGALRTDSGLGSFPAGVRVNPYLIDLNPAIFGWFASRPQTQLVASLTDGGASYTPEGQAAWTNTYRRYLAVSNGSMPILNFFGPARQKFIEPLDFPFVISGYLGSAKKPEWGMLGNEAQTVWCTIVGASRNGDENAEEPLRAAVKEAEQPGRPLFILARCKGTPTVLKQQIDRFISDPPAGRKVLLLSPGDLAATYRQWAVPLAKRQSGR